MTSLVVYGLGRIRMNCQSLFKGPSSVIRAQAVCTCTCFGRLNLREHGFFARETIQHLFPETGPMFA